MITESIEIACKPEDVYSYLDQLERHAEWQEQIKSVKLDQQGPTKVGTRVVETRVIGNREMVIPYEITEHDPPRLTSFRGTDGPVRVRGTVKVESLDNGVRSKVTIELDFVGHGIGKLMAPMARRAAKKQVPQDQKRLKEILESEL